MFCHKCKQRIEKGKSVGIQIGYYVVRMHESCRREFIKERITEIEVRRAEHVRDTQHERANAVVHTDGTGARPED
ncbi:hypothetical protein HC928_00495 [bacterium]|nr:hypothetical protein [bacterium]